MFNKVYEQKLKEENSFSVKPPQEAMFDFLDQGANSAFYTSLDLIPIEVLCEVSFTFIYCMNNK